MHMALRRWGISGSRQLRQCLQLTRSLHAVASIRRDSITYALIYRDLQVNLITRTHPSSDGLVLRQIWIDKEYEPACEAVDRHETPVRVVVDVGANAGYSAMYFARRFPTAVVIALEPDPENYDMLVTNVAANAATNVKPLRMALWVRNTTLSIHKDRGDGRSWSFYVEEDPSDRIEGVDLSTICSDYDLNIIDLLKMDIEGAEFVLFSNPAFVTMISHKVRLLALEIHDPWGSREAMLAQLAAIGFECHTHGETTFAVNIRFQNESACTS